MKRWQENHRWVECYPAFDKRHSEPDKNYGLHGVEMTFFYGNGQDGVVQFKLYTNWHLPHVHKELDKEWMEYETPMMFKPLPADLGYHSPVPRYEDQLCSECDMMDGKACYYDGSGLRAEDAFKVLVSGGTEALWAFLQGEWEVLFGPKEDDD